MRNLASILELVSFIMTASGLVLVVACLATGRDLLAIYWGAFVVIALRFGFGLPEPD